MLRPEDISRLREAIQKGLTKRRGLVPIEGPIMRKRLGHSYHSDMKTHRLKHGKYLGKLTRKY